MSSQPPSPSQAGAPPSSQQHGQPSSSPHSRADSAVHIDESPTQHDKADADSSFQSNASERHPKAKRKRTAAKDKAILEAAYNANPKPDKAARLDIVRRVSLNEKEVQIWFQNRRQNDRRKSRPLSAQEIAALQYSSSMQTLPPSSDSAATSTVAPYTASNPSSSLPTTHTTSPVPQSSVLEREDASPQPSPPSPREISELSEGLPEVADTRDTRRESAPSVRVSVGPSSQPVEFTAGAPSQLCRSSSVGYFANRLHAGLQPARHSPESYSHDFESAPRPCSGPTPAVLPPLQSSKFRLAMSMGGKAELIPQPSPPRLSPTALSDSSVPPDRPNLHRTYSAAESVTLPPISALTASLETDVAPPAPSHILLQPQPRCHPRLYRSRSRDVHAWEMACEASSVEHRDELTAYAERESSGSAIAAISLMRTLSSSSHSSVMGHSVSASNLQSAAAKRNARPSAYNQHHAKKPKLGRASSSVGRLQTSFVNSTIDKPPVRGLDVDADVDELKKVKMSMLLSPGGNDSDKENWSPADDYHPAFRGSQRAATGRRPLPSAPLSKVMPSLATAQSSRRRVLEDGTNRFLLGRASTAPMSNRRKGEAAIEIFEDGSDDADASDDEDQPPKHRARGGVTDDEVEKFMRGEVSPSKKGAASAIAGLLALSQGNWR